MSTMFPEISKYWRYNYLDLNQDVELLADFYRGTLPRRCNIQTTPKYCTLLMVLRNAMPDGRSLWLDWI